MGKACFSINFIRLKSMGPNLNHRNVATSSFKNNSEVQKQYCNDVTIITVVREILFPKNYFSSAKNITSILYPI